MASVKQTKKLLGIFKGRRTQAIIDMPGTETFYSSDLYTSAEDDDLLIVMKDRDTPTREELRRLFHSKTDKEIDDIKSRLDSRIARVT